MDKLDQEKAEDAFQQFLMEMDDRIEGLQQEAEGYQLALDLSDDSLDALEKFILKILNSKSNPDVKSLAVTCGRYLGEVMARNHHGRWILSLDDPKNINFNQPVVIGHGASKTEFAPVSVCRAFILKKTPGLIKKAYLSQLSPRQLDLSKLIEPD
ncbi:MAG: hypothetical protein EOP36_19120 [Rubrivivax sp.]|nr:MAG: hypothetical protein EOP36_19120 [Rubrivivax sp.]